MTFVSVYKIIHAWIQMILYILLSNILGLHIVTRNIVTRKYEARGEFFVVYGKNLSIIGLT